MKKKTDEIAMTEAEREFISRFTAERCRPHAEVVAGLRRAGMRLSAEKLFLSRECAAEALPLAAGPAAARTAPDVKSPNEEIRFLFSAESRDGDIPEWRAEVAVPPGADASTPVEIRVRRSNGAPVPAAVLRLAGRSLRVADGVAVLPFGEFISGMEDTDVSLSEPDAAPVKGALAFF